RRARTADSTPLRRARSSYAVYPRPPYALRRPRESARRQLRSDAMWKEFKQFIARGNVVDLAVGVIIGAALGKIVSDLVDRVIMPPDRLILQHVDFQSLFVVLDSSKGYPRSLAESKTKGVPVIAY